MKLAATSMPSIPMATPVAAVRRGAPAATTDPRVTIRTMAAMTRPSSSVADMPIDVELPMLAPRWTVRSGLLFCVALASWVSSFETALALGPGSPAASPTDESVCTRMRAWWPSRETVRVCWANGSVTVDTPSIFRAFPMKDSIAARWPSMSPPVEKSTCSLAPAAWGSRLAMTASPSMDSVPVTLYVVARFIPVAATIPPRAIMSRSHPAKTRLAWEAVHPPTR